MRSAEFLGVSLYIVGPSGDLVADELTRERTVISLGHLEGAGFQGRFQTLADANDLNTPIHEFSRIIGSFSKRATVEWDALTFKEFHVNILSGLGPRYFETIVEHETLSAISILKARLKFHIRPPRPP